MLEALRSVAQSIFSRNPLGKDHHYFYDDIIEYFNTQVKNNRNDVNAYLLLGKLLRLKGEPNRAFKLHANLLSHPKITKTDLNRLNLEIGFDALHAKLDDYGIEHFEKALLHRQTAPMAHYGLYKAHALKGNKDKTRKHLETLVKQKHAPKIILVNLYSQHLDTLSNEGDAQHYLRLAEKASLLNPQHPDFQLHLARALYQNKLYQKALSYIDTVIDASPHIKDMLIIVEDIFYTQNKYSELEYQLETWLKRKEHAQLHILMAKLLQKKRKANLAKNHLHKAFILDSKNPDLFLAILNGDFNLDDFNQFKSSLT